MAQLWMQLGAATLMVTLSTLVHGLRLVALTRIFRLHDERLEDHSFDRGAVLLMGSIAFSLFMLHAVEIWMYAGFYLLIGAIGQLEEALFYSVSAYATLGYTADYFPPAWRLLGASEALVGFLMLGWSTAFLVQNTNKLRSR